MIAAEPEVLANNQHGIMQDGGWVQNSIKILALFLIIFYNITAVGSTQ